MKYEGESEHLGRHDRYEMLQYRQHDTVKETNTLQVRKIKHIKSIEFFLIYGLLFFFRFQCNVFSHFRRVRKTFEKK